MIEYIAPISTVFTDMINELPPAIVILELWHDHKLQKTLKCDILWEIIDSNLTDNKGICVIDFVLKCAPNEAYIWGMSAKMFYRRWEFGTHLIEENGLPHYAFVAVPIDIEYKVLNISTNNKRLYVKGELVGI